MKTFKELLSEINLTINKNLFGKHRYEISHNGELKSLSNDKDEAHKKAQKASKDTNSSSSIYDTKKDTYHKYNNGEYKGEYKYDGKKGTKINENFKYLLNEIEEKTKGSVGAKKTGTILSKGTKEMAKDLHRDPYHNRRMHRARDKETDTHYETHFDSDYETGLVTRVHKKTGKVEHNFGVEYHKAYRDRDGNKYEATSNFKKHPNGEFK